MQTRKPAVGSAPNALPLVRMNKNEAPQMAPSTTSSSGVIQSRTAGLARAETGVVLQSAVAAHPQSSPEEQILREGQQMLIRSDGLGPIVALNLGADAWTRGMLVVDNAPVVYTSSVIAIGAASMMRCSERGLNPQKCRGKSSAYQQDPKRLDSREPAFGTAMYRIPPGLRSA